MRSDRHPWRWLSAWAVLNGLGTVLHHALWSGQTGGSTAGVLLQGFGDAVHILIGPACVMLRAIARDWPTDSWVGPLTANAIGWMFWVLAIRVAVEARRWLLRRSRSAPPHSSIGRLSPAPNTPPRDTGLYDK